jgi:hypothetical protein
MLSISSIPTEVDKFLLKNFTMDLIQLAFIAHMTKLISSLLDTTLAETEDLAQVNSIKLSLPMTVTLNPQFKEDHLTILQDHLEEMTASQDLPLWSIALCGELISELRMQLKQLDKDLLLDQDSTLMKPSIPLIIMDLVPLAQQNSKEICKLEVTL